MFPGEIMSADEPSEHTRAQRREYFVIYVLCVALLAALGMLWLRQQGYFRAAPVVRHNPGKVVQKPIELNSARWFELTQIRGIGEKRAKDVIDLRDRKIREQRQRREKQVGFKSIDELLEVRGITPDILERVRKKVRLEPRGK